MSYMISCRAKVVSSCLDGKPTSVQFFGDDLPMEEDGTYRVAVPWEPGPPEVDQGTIICDQCYCWLMPRTPSGKGLHHELDAAIAAAKAGKLDKPLPRLYS